MARLDRIPSTQPARRATIVLTLLTAAYLLSYVDRQILALMIEPIKRDLAITDLQFSFLTGLAFSIFFALAGLPLAHASDRFPRNRIIGLGVLCWSIATIASGLAHSYGHIFLARIFVGIGEAALTPAAYSLLADIVAPAALGRAIAVFSMGSQLGAATAYLLGGSILTMLQSPQFAAIGAGPGLEAWQMVFVMVGLPGFLLAPAILMLVEDPRRTATIRPSLRDAWAALRPVKSRC